MWLSCFFAVAVGISIVGQAGLNREISIIRGLAGTLLWNCTLTFLISLLIWGLVVLKPSLFPEFVRVQPGADFWNAFNGKQVLAALCGITIIYGIPLVMSHIGALKAFSLIIATQLISAMAWDAFREGLPVSFQRIVGAAVAFIGALIALKG